MQKEINLGFVMIAVCCSLVAGTPQNNFNNYPFRPTFSDLDSNYYYTTASPYQQNYIRIWPYIIDQAVSPLYNWNWNSNLYSNGYNNGYNNVYNSGYNAYPFNWFNYNNAYTTTVNPYLSVFNPYGTTYSGKK